jgi:hypothetical protein
MVGILLLTTSRTSEGHPASRRALAAERGTLSASELDSLAGFFVDH